MVQVLTNLAVLVSFPFLIALYFLQCLVSIREKRMPHSLIFRRELRVVLLEQAVVQKRFLEYPQYSVYRAAIQNRGQAWFWDSELQTVDWERGSLQGCSLFQDR